MGDEEINWYRVPVDKQELKKLTRRSDGKGLAQALSHLALAAATGFAVYYTFHYFFWPWLILAFFLHGTVMQFLGGAGAFHELCHGTPFRTRWINEIFLGIVSFLSWSNPVFFRTSHVRHHQYTVFMGWDLEVVLPVRVRLVDFLLSFIINPIGIYAILRAHVRHSLGILEGEWENRIFSGDGEPKRSGLFAWARVLILGHLALAAAFVLMGQWILIPIVLTPWYASWLTYLCGMPQHFGLHRTPGLEEELPDGSPGSGLQLPVLADELPHRAPHVRRGAVPRAAKAPSGHCVRLPEAQPGADLRVEGDCHGGPEAEAGSRVRVRPVHPDRIGDADALPSPGQRVRYGL